MFVAVSDGMQKLNFDTSANR